MGQLQKMMDKQRELQARLGYNFNEMSTEELTAYIKEYSIHLNQEVNEMLYELPFFKPWKDYSNMSVDEVAEQHVKARKEYVDCLHFFLNLGLALGYCEDDLVADFFQKNKENHQRQDEGYTHDKSFR